MPQHVPMKFRFKNFKVYQEAKEYSQFCRGIVHKHFRMKDPALVSQIERALNSIVLNIAEGSADASDAEFARFLGISTRSLYETVAGFDLATLYGYIGEDLNQEIEDQGHI